MNMKKSKIKLMILSGLLITSFFSITACNANQTAEQTKEKVEQGTESAKQKVEQGTESAKESVEKGTESAKESVEKMFSDTELKYDKNTLMKDLEAKGYQPKVENKTNSELAKVFSVKEETVKIKGGEIYVYEYAKDEKDKLKTDIAAIKNNGNTINGATMTWNVKPHFYNKGRVLVIYDGNSEEILKSLSEILGTPIVG